jgi:hypothetical protein
MDYPVKVSFSGHETFPFRYAWLKKGVDAVDHTPDLFADEESAMVELGVGKNMVRSIRHWCLATEVIEEAKVAKSRRAGHRVTGLGKLLLGDDGFDPFLEDPATLWILHWQLASSPHRATTWFWAFSHVHEAEFSRQDLTSQLQSWATNAAYSRISPASLRRDIDCFRRTYVPSRHAHAAILEDTLDCPLIELELVREAGERSTYRFNTGAQDHLPNFVLFHATLRFIDDHLEGRQSASLHELAYGPRSPGMVFKIDENSLAHRYESIEEELKGALVYDETAGLRQLYRRAPVDPVDVLCDGYRRYAAVSAGGR